MIGVVIFKIIFKPPFRSVHTEITIHLVKNKPELNEVFKLQVGASISTLVRPSLRPSVKQMSKTVKTLSKTCQKIIG